MTAPTGRLGRLWVNRHLWLGVGLVAAILPLTASSSWCWP